MISARDQTYGLSIVTSSKPDWLRLHRTPGPLWLLFGISIIAGMDDLAVPVMMSAHLKT